MLQIIIFQLSVGIWLLGSLNESLFIKGAGIVLAILFIILGLAQVSNIPSLDSY